MPTDISLNILIAVISRIAQLDTLEQNLDQNDMSGTQVILITVD